VAHGLRQRRGGLNAMLPAEPMDTLQETRLEAVLQVLLRSGARSVLDLGCGPGELLARLVLQPQFERIVGIDIDSAELAAARELLAQRCPAEGRLRLECASFTQPDERFRGFDAAALVETIEHIDPHRLAELERAVFGCFRPQTVVVTTPNREFNVVYGLDAGEFRHPDHRFEWTRPKFRRWAQGIAARNGYEFRLGGIGERDAELGCSTQIATFRLRAPES
jgi:small RNA 2'-O-methyltransferase